VSFFTYQDNPMNRVGNPGIVGVSDNLCDIEKSLEEVIEWGNSQNQRVSLFNDEKL